MRVRNVFSLGRRTRIPNSANTSGGAVRTQEANPATDRIPAAVARIMIANNPTNGTGFHGDHVGREPSSTPPANTVRP
jgi:hypothetical protein